MDQVLFVVNNTTPILALWPYAEHKALHFILAKTMQEALALLAENPAIAWVIADQYLADGPGLELLLALDESRSRLVLIGEPSACKPPGVTAVLPSDFEVSALDRLFNSAQVVPSPGTFYGLVGDSVAMQKLYTSIQRVAPTAANAFIIGPSGSGKELVANAIHQLSRRAKQAYLAINCGAISETLISSLLFGHEKGSFTGAVQSHKGYFEQVSGGTLFLDEITETSPSLQVSLLRVLESRQILPIGGKRMIDVDVRILASTNRDPAEAVRQGVLREDLYHRLNVFPLRVPALSERLTDIDALSAYFLQECNQHYQGNKRLEASAVEKLKSLAYPGNVRQLKNIIHRAYILADEHLASSHIESY